MGLWVACPAFVALNLLLVIVSLKKRSFAHLAQKRPSTWEKIKRRYNLAIGALLFFDFFFLGYIFLNFWVGSGAD